MTEIKHISTAIQSTAYKMTHGGYSPDFPIRVKGKKTRFFIDNEYLQWGYAKNLSKHATLVYITLARHANAKTQACFPGMEKIVEESGICNKRYVSSGIKELEEHNIIYVNRQGKRMTNCYYLLNTSVWKRLPGFETNTIHNEPSVKSDNAEGQNKPPARVEFAPVNHRSNSYEEIESKKTNHTDKLENNDSSSFFNGYYKKEDIQRAISELAIQGIRPGMHEVGAKLADLAFEKKIIPLKKMPINISSFIR